LEIQNSDFRIRVDGEEKGLIVSRLQNPYSHVIDLMAFIRPEVFIRKSPLSLGTPEKLKCLMNP
jgi:hypothetical protein